MNNLTLGSGCVGYPLDLKTGHAVEYGLAGTRIGMFQDHLAIETLVFGIPGPLFGQTSISASAETNNYCICLGHDFRSGHSVLYCPQRSTRVALSILNAIIGSPESLLSSASFLLRLTDSQKLSFSFAPSPINVPSSLVSTSISPSEAVNAFSLPCSSVSLYSSALLAPLLAA